MLIKIKCSECGEHTFPEGEIDPSGDLQINVPPCPKCLKDQVKEIIEEIKEAANSTAIISSNFIIYLIEKKAGL